MRIGFPGVELEPFGAVHVFAWSTRWRLDGDILKLGAN